MTWVSLVTCLSGPSLATPDAVFYGLLGSPFVALLANVTLEAILNYCFSCFGLSSSWEEDVSIGGVGFSVEPEAATGGSSAPSQYPAIAGSVEGGIMLATFGASRDAIFTCSSDGSFGGVGLITVILDVVLPFAESPVLDCEALSVTNEYSTFGSA